VNPKAILASWEQVLLLSLLVVVGKWLINVSLGLLLPASATTMLVVAAGLSQIGEFTFIVGALGVSLSVLSQEQYGLILAAATISIMVNPYMFALIPYQEALLQHFPRVRAWLHRRTPMPAALEHSMHDHIIIVGHGRVGTYIGRVLTQLHLPYLAVECDAVVARAMQEAGIITLFGDAANSEILRHTAPAAARALVVTVADETTAAVVVASVHAMAPHLPIIARAATESGMHRLAAVGASQIIHPALEGGLEIMRHTLLALGYPPEHIQPYVDAVRGDTYAALAAEGTRPYVLDQLITATRGVAIAWHPVVAHSTLVGKSMKEANLRARVGASVIALLRRGRVVPNPPSDTQFEVDDLVGVIGTAHELAATAALLAPHPRLAGDDCP
jgi:CPA2 family monovalent cation:H+ antiporter-2